MTFRWMSDIFPGALFGKGGSDLRVRWIGVEVCSPVDFDR